MKQLEGITLMTSPENAMSLSSSITDKKRQLQLLMRQAHWDDAVMLCQMICEAAPGDIEAWVLNAAISSEVGDFEQATYSCRRALVLQPGIARMHYNLGVALQKLGRHKEALESYRAATALEPTHAPGLANLALTLRDVGDVEQAIVQASEAIRLEPRLVEAHETLGLALMDLHRWKEAAESFAQAIRLAPDSPAGHVHLGMCLEGMENAAEAMASYLRAVDLDPSHADALSRIGYLLTLQGKRRDAVTWLRRAAEADPDNLTILVALGNALMTLADYYRYYTEAEQYLLRARAISPEDISPHLGLVTVYQNQGRYLEALNCLERVTAVEPQHIEAIAVRALLLERIGQVQCAREVLQPMMDSGVDHVRLDLAFAPVARHLKRGAEAISRLEAQLKKTDLEAEWRRDAHYALGKLYDEAGEYDLSFEHYRAANRLNPDQYNESQHQALFDALARIYSKESVKLRPRASNRSKLPIFIVGMPRSGTSLVEQILASHRHIHGGGELNYIPEIGDNIQNMLGVEVVYPYFVDMLDRRLLDQVARAHLETLTRLGPKAARVTDKMPHNFRWLGLIDQLFPGASVIHCTRDPMDNCLSIHFQKFNMHHAYSSDLGALGRYYIRYQALMEHWRNALRIPILDVRYEDLIADQEGVTRKLIDFCGLGWDDQCLRFHESGRIVTTPSYDQVRKPVYSKSVARWKKYESHLGPLKEGLGWAEKEAKRASENAKSGAA